MRISETIGGHGPVFREVWSPFDSELAKEDEAEIVLQVNDKTLQPRTAGTSRQLTSNCTFVIIESRCEPRSMLKMMFSMRPRHWLWLAECRSGLRCQNLPVVE